MLEYSYHHVDVTDGQSFYFSDFYTDYQKMIDKMRRGYVSSKNCKTYVRRWTDIEDFVEFEIDREALLRSRECSPTSLNKSQVHLRASSKSNI